LSEPEPPPHLTHARNHNDPGDRARPLDPHPAVGRTSTPMTPDTPKLTPPQFLLLENLINHTSQNQLDKGIELQAMGNVQDIAAHPTNDSITAIVVAADGKKRFAVTLSFTPYIVLSRCSCGYGQQCKHAAALALELQSPAPEATPAPAPSQPSAPPPPDLEPAPDPTLSELVSEKLSRHLPRPAAAFLKSAEEWFDSSARQINLSRFIQALGRQPDWNQHHLTEIHHPDLPPRNAWDFLAYLQILAASKNLELPDPIPEAIDPDLVRELNEKTNTIREAEVWKSRFHSWRNLSASKRPRRLELRLVLDDPHPYIQSREAGTENFSPAKLKLLRECDSDKRYNNTDSTLLDPGSSTILRIVQNPYGAIQSLDIGAFSSALTHTLAQLVPDPDLLARHVVDHCFEPVSISDTPLEWRIIPPDSKFPNHYRIDLVNADGRSMPPAIAVLPGPQRLYVSALGIHPIPAWPFGKSQQRFPFQVPATAVETRSGVAAFAELSAPLPPKLQARIQRVPLAVQAAFRYDSTGSSQLHLQASAKAKNCPHCFTWTGSSWSETSIHKTEDEDSPIISLDKSALAEAATWLAACPFDLMKGTYDHKTRSFRLPSKAWPNLFLQWIATRPHNLKLLLDHDLASLREGAIAGRVTIDLEESADIDWFDLSVALKVDDTTLTQDEIALLLKARGEWVRLADKGWRKLNFEMTDEQIDELADLGLASRDFSDEKQRLHALQLGALAKKKSTLLEPARVEQVRRRIEEIHTRVTPPAPTDITATLRPYQLDGFHFLAYLTENRFGGVLADDMGLGKTLQALCWLSWLRTHKPSDAPALVVCPKSVQDNWRTEAQRFLPGLRVEVWNRDSTGKTGLDGSCDLLVIHYAQLRTHEEKLRAARWSAVILDEAQNIKNPASQTARAACNLASPHRLALTGTPIENRLLDLWSIFQFAMPGILGNRAAFLKNFDKKEDPFARRRLAARTRPFLLRRTKTEVASDLPERVEEDIVVELEGTQAKLYQAELKRARAQLLKAETDKQLDKLRFNILTSLLRLRQICCHPRLLGIDGSDDTPEPKKKSKKTTPASKPNPKPTSQAAPEADSAKLSALLDLLEPLIEEGQKVIVFSQFLEMLDLAGQALATREWKSFRLDGSTEDRGQLVHDFQTHEGPAVFLISLKAGGSGLNLTAAAYVVLFDPWWNPAVEAQAIDRTHRIGQKQTVFAYRLIVKNTIEEKIRRLQKQKGALANDILGEENFAQALTLSDFQFLLGEEN
jgi:SNF2 family DNA or RNA helicase